MPSHTRKLDTFDNIKYDTKPFQRRGIKVVSAARQVSVCKEELTQDTFTRQVKLRLIHERNQQLAIFSFTDGRHDQGNLTSTLSNISHFSKDKPYPFYPPQKAAMITHTNTQEAVEEQQGLMQSGRHHKSEHISSQGKECAVTSGRTQEHSIRHRGPQLHIKTQLFITMWKILKVSK